MARHFLLIDPLEKLNFKKDSSLLLALSLKEQGHDVYVFFEADFAFSNQRAPHISATAFQGVIDQETFYLKDFKLLSERVECTLTSADTIHMRLDPPFDTRYLRVLWMLMAWQRQCGVKVLNDPKGIALYNEKLTAYERKKSLASYVGASESLFFDFVDLAKSHGVDALILKPLDLFQGYGVEKVDINDDLKAIFKRKVEECKGAVVVQPFDSSVTKGEVRSIYFKARELGTILKVPPAGQFLANIAQGATFDRYDLSSELKKECETICKDLMNDGVDWVAFDILGNNISEVNITCPGLLVEVSKAMKKNLALEISR